MPPLSAMGAPRQQACAERGFTFSAVELGLFAAMTAALQRAYGGRLQSVLLVGSRARGTPRPDSDYDVLVVLDECDYAIDCPRLAALGEELRARFATPELSLSPLSDAKFPGLDAKYPGITDAFRRDAIRLWPD